MPNKGFADPAYWRNRAEEARAVAAELSDPEAKRMMEGIAASYEALATYAEKQVARGKLPPNE